MSVDKAKGEMNGAFGGGMSAMSKKASMTMSADRAKGQSHALRGAFMSRPELYKGYVAHKCNIARPRPPSVMYQRWYTHML